MKDGRLDGIVVGNETLFLIPRYARLTERDVYFWVLCPAAVVIPMGVLSMSSLFIYFFLVKYVSTERYYTFQDKDLILKNLIFCVKKREISPEKLLHSLNTTLSLSLRSVGLL